MQTIKTLAQKAWVNGKIYTVDRDFSIASCMACTNGKLIYVGNSVGLKCFVDSNTQIIDLCGATVFPGFIDSHLHLEMYGDSLLALPIRDKSKEEILSLVRDAVKNLPKGEWLVAGVGWNNEVWQNPDYPNKEELDEVASDNPVILPRMDGHMIWVNSAAFKVADITDSTPNPEGGVFLRNIKGGLLGCASNTAANLIRKCIPVKTKNQRKKALLAAHKELLKYGVTSVQELMTSQDIIEDLEELFNDGEYKIRVGCSIDGKLLIDTEQSNIEALFENLNKKNITDKLRVKTVKILSDGSIGAQSAALTEDYMDSPGNRGKMQYSEEDLLRIATVATEHGYQITSHAIGDAAIEAVLKTYGIIKQNFPDIDHRYRIEHFQTITGNLLEQAKAIDAVISMQPTHGPNSASMAIRRLGKERASKAYAVGLALRSQGLIAGGSDAPVAPPNPLDGMHSAVTRTNSQGLPEGGFFMENAVSLKEALKMYTIWGAYAQKCEQIKGSLEAGKLADFVVLDKDIFEVNPSELLSINVLHTVISGEVCYSKE
ncbi:MAG: amidohydrolase [Christensenellaceae bacterium]|nr:amidohydrolase [Christensenellaceae bacterium]